MDHEVGPWKMVQLLEKSIYKAFGPLTRCKPNVDQEEWSCIRKVNEFIFLTICPKRVVLEGKKKIWFHHSFVFACLCLASLLVFACFHLWFQQSWLQWKRRGGAYFALRIVHVFVHVHEACSGHSSIAFVMRMRGVRNFELSLWENEA